MSYQDEVIQTIVAKFVPELQAAANGHCMKLTGVTDTVLEALYSRFTAEVSPLRCYILSREITGPQYIQATKLVELRNSYDDAPLLVLCPATLRTAAEDSFGSATFRELPVDDIEARIYQRLDKALRQTDPALAILLDYLKVEVPVERANQFMLAIQDESIPTEQVGNELWRVGLLPDSGLYEDRNQVKARLNYNQQCLGLLCDFTKGTYNRLSTLPIDANTIQTEIAKFLKENNKLKSASDIVSEIAKRYPALNFANWPVSDLKRAHSVKVIVEELKKVGDSLILESDGSLLLRGKAGETVKIKLKLTTDPKPNNVQELARFRADLMQVTGAGESECVYENFDRWGFTKNKQNSRTRDVAFDANAVEPGNYFLRVFALDEFNNVLNTNDDFRDRLDQRAWETEQQQGNSADRSRIKGKWTSDTANFLFVIDDSDVPPPPDPGRREKVGSVLQSYFSYRLDLLRAKERDPKLLDPAHEDWKWLNAADRQITSVFQARYAESRFNFQVQVSSKLRQFQDSILSNPDGLGLLKVTEIPSIGQPFSAQYLMTMPSRLRELPEVTSFLAIRRLFFQQIQENAGGHDGIWETFDLVRNVSAVENYVEAYNQLLASIEQRLSSWENLADSEKADLQAILQAVQELDLVFIHGKLPDSQEKYTTLLIPPLHPLRLGWFVGLLDMFTEWEMHTRADYDRQLHLWRDELIRLFFDGIKPTNHTLLISDETGQAFEYAGELAFGWGLFTRTSPVQTETVGVGSLHRSLIQYLQQTLDIAAQTGWVENDVDQGVVYKHIRNYLSLHPYTEQVIINLFNAGEGQVFRDVLLKLQNEAELAQVRYEIRLFVNERSFVADGEAINRLINPATTQTGTADAFSQPGRNRLFPKLRLSINRISEYIADPATYDCHLSFLINPFPQRPKIQVPDGQTPSFYLNGLVVQPVVQFDYDQAGGTSAWTRYVSPIGVGSISLVSKITQEAFGRLSLFAGASLAGKPTSALPATELVVGSAETMLLDKIHSYSDWVITFDRHLGPEIFDLPVGAGEEPFLLDYVPGENFLGINTFLTSKPGTEVHQLIAPIVHTIFSSVSGTVSAASTATVLNDLRTLSGSLVMQLSRQPHPAKVLEYTGLALAKRLLERKGLLEKQFIIPLDLHRQLIQAEKDTDSQSRADLLLIDIDVEKRKLFIQVVEVKMRTTALSTSDRFSLYDSVDDQLTNTVNRLRQRFSDEEQVDHLRFDRQIRTKELSDLLLFYAGRAERYGLMNPDEASHVRSFLATLDKPCSMEFAKRGIVFDLDSSVDIIKEIANDVIFYRIGKQGLATILDEEIDLRTRRPDSSWETFQRDLTRRPTPSSQAFDPLLLPPAPTRSDDLSASLQSDNSPGLETAIIQTSNVEPIELESSLNVSNLELNTFGELNSLGFDTYVGDTDPSNQFGILGKTQTGQVVALDLSGTHTISLFGVQGAGKSYSIGTITEMVLAPIPKVNSLPNPLAGVIFHYSQDQNYKPEFTSMAYPNDVPREADKLWQEYGARPQGMTDLVLLVPKAKLEERQADYPHLRVESLSIASTELGIQDWRFLMGAVGNQSLYIKHLNSIMKSLRGQMTLEGLKQGIQNSALLTAAQRELALSRLSLADEYIDDAKTLGSLMQPGRLLLVDLRDEFLDQDDALGLFVVMLNIFANVKRANGSTFNKFIVFDEAHKYMNNGDLTENIVETIRLMRHKGVSILIASQDPPSLPNAIIELSSTVIVHKFNSPQWLKHIQRSITQFDKLTPTDMAHLGPGEAYLWSTKANKKQMTQQPTKISTRPRVTKHGGSTRRAGE